MFPPAVQDVPLVYHGGPGLKQGCFAVLQVVLLEGMGQAVGSLEDCPFCQEREASQGQWDQGEGFVVLG